MVSFASVAASILAVIAQFSSLQSTEAAFGCAEAPANPGDRRTDTSQLKVTTFNAAFLFLGTASHGLKCPGSDCPWTTAADAQNHVNQIASVIKSLNSDIIQINEVEDCTVLEAVITQLKALGDSTYKPYLIKGADTSTGQNSALLTRIDPVVDLQRTEVRASIPVSGSTCPSSSGYSSTKGVSKHFYTTFNVTGFSKPLTLVGAHLLANPESKPRCFEREAQATVLAGLGNAAVGGNHHAIITGDLNDWSAAVLDKNSNAPISAVLSILVGSNFVDVASKVAKADRYTEWYDEDNDCVYEDTELSSLDHMLVSKSLSSALKSVTFNHDLYTTSCSGYNSDHYPISISLKEP
ncbi:Endonuclease uclease phosphatase [Phytophthora megakarya]|uniref:Endonuclease uclease phosphatase n=1 Tax=Phytophthora megakarya TaxID=4795 RepID=A0A225W4N4_9STRA|nr:Endonuclease uclease phosphatase [Phytophthora megakarya]